MGSWIYLRHYQCLRILSSMLPLASPFSDSITAQLAPVLSQILAPAHAALFALSPSTAASLSTTLQRWWTTPAQYATVGPFTLDWAAQQYKSPLSQWTTFPLLAALQSVNIFWLALMFRVLWRGVRTLGRERVDERSVYDEDEDERDGDAAGAPPVFEDAGKSAAEVVGLD
jgi:acyl-CoA-dependent ceramide synthase